jgi:hypothetical protein
MVCPIRSSTGAHAHICESFGLIQQPIGPKWQNNGRLLCDQSGLEGDIYGRDWGHFGCVYHWADSLLDCGWTRARRSADATPS